MWNVCSFKTSNKSTTFWRKAVTFNCVCAFVWFPVSASVCPFESESACLCIWSYECPPGSTWCQEGAMVWSEKKARNKTNANIVGSADCGWGDALRWLQIMRHRIDLASPCFSLAENLYSGFPRASPISVGTCAITKLRHQRLPVRCLTPKS